MPIKKSELYSSLWESCDELRGGMDASQYKDYVLVLLFVKYVSDKYAGQKDALLDVPVGGRFADMVALKGDKEIGDKINKIIGKGECDSNDSATEITSLLCIAHFLSLACSLLRCDGQETGRRPMIHRTPCH